MVHHGAKSSRPKIVLGICILAVCCCSLALAADSIKGAVHNQTNNGPAAGDDVLLLGAGQDKREEGRAKTDSEGSFTFGVQHPDKPHLIRVIHQGVNYDRRVSAGNAISIDVADARAEVKSITGGIEIIRAGTHENRLHITDMVEIMNLSNPPVTEANERTFEVYLPGDAKIESVLAAGPENIGSMISATPIRGEPGHYTVNFPLQPGATKFAVNYDLPYDGRTTLRTKNMYPLQQLAVMIPPTMKFVSQSIAFQILPVVNDRYHVEAAEHIKAGERLEFQISGVGVLPSVRAQFHAPPQAQVDGLHKPPAGTLTSQSVLIPNGFGAQARNGSALGAVAVSKVSAPSSEFQWWILGAGAAFILGIFAWLVWRRKHPYRNTIKETAIVIEQSGQTSESIVEALKEGLFQLESDRLQGVIPREEYVLVRQALEGTIEWAVARAGARGEATLITH